MAPFRDLVGEQFGRLTVVALVSRHRVSVWRLRCVCGNEIVAPSTVLGCGNTRSCGCFKLERNREVPFVHGQTRTPTYRSWSHAKERCYNPNTKNYPEYGGRGIRMCDEWRNNFAAFFAYIGPKPRGYLLDRINNDGHYEPGNVRWVTHKESANNRRRQRTWLGRPLPWYAAQLAAGRR